MVIGVVNAGPALFRTIDAVSVTGPDRDALNDAAAGRLIDSETMSRRLGGWQLARTASGEPAFHASDRVDPARLYWAETAASACDRLRAMLAAFGNDGDDRLAAALIAAMVRLIVDGPDHPNGIADVPLSVPLALRIVSEGDRVIVLGVHTTDLIR
jgi:hypothetical protein